MTSVGCPSCGTEITSIVEICPYCGKALPEILKTALKDALIEEKRKAREEDRPQEVLGFVTFNKRTANILIKLAFFAGLFSSLFTILPFLYGVKGFLLGAVLLFGLSYVLLLPSRTAAIGLLVYMIYSKLTQWSGIGPYPTIFGEINLWTYIIGSLWIFIFFLGVLGTSHPEMLEKQNKSINPFDFEKEYTRNQLMKGTRPFLIVMGLFQIIWAYDLKMYAWRGIAIVGGIYIIAGLIKSFWFRFICVCVWTWDVLLTNGIRGTLDIYTVIWPLLGAIIIYKMWKYRNNIQAAA